MRIIVLIASSALLLVQVLLGVWLWDVSFRLETISKRLEILSETQRPVAMITGKYPYIAISEGQIYVGGNVTEVSREGLRKRD